MKLVLLGEGRVGKTSIVNRWVNNVFDPDQPSTVDAQMYVKKKLFVDGKSVEIALWDTAGQERYHALGPLYYRNADGAILVYDCTDEDTFDRVRRWIKELQKAANPNIQIVICGNKADREKERQVPEAKANTFAKKYSAEHFSTSAKTNLGVDEAFLHLIRSVVAVKEGRLAGNGIDDNDDLFGNMALGGDDDNNNAGSSSAKKKKSKTGGRLKIVEDDGNNGAGDDDNGGMNNYNGSNVVGPDVSASGTKIGGSRINPNQMGRSSAETDEWLSSTRGDDEEENNDDDGGKKKKKKQQQRNEDDEDGGYSSFTRGNGRYGGVDDDEEENSSSNNNNKKNKTSKSKTTGSKNYNNDEDEDDDSQNKKNSSSKKNNNNDQGDTDYAIDDGSNWNPGSSSKTVTKTTTPAASASKPQEEKPKTINLANAPKPKSQEEKKGCPC